MPPVSPVGPSVQPDTYGGPIPEPPPSDPQAFVAPHMPTGAEVAAAIEAETAQVHGEVSGVMDDVARLRLEIEALKRSMAGAGRAPKPARASKPARKTSAKKR
jgi:hypothetical protein